MSVKRYDLGFDEGGCNHEIFEEPEGEYVTYADYAALESALKEMPSDPVRLSAYDSNTLVCDEAGGFCTLDAYHILSRTARAYADALAESRHIIEQQEKQLAEAQRECERLKEIDRKSNTTFEQLHQEANIAEQECSIWRERAEKAERECERLLREIKVDNRLLAHQVYMRDEATARAERAEAALKACVEALEEVRANEDASFEVEWARDLPADGCDCAMCTECIRPTIAAAREVLK